MTALCRLRSATARLVIGWVVAIASALVSGVAARAAAGAPVDAARDSKLESTFAAPDAPPSQVATPTVRIGVREVSPILFIDADGRPSGYFGEMLGLVEARGNVRFSVVKFETLEQLLAAARRGEIDAVAPLMRTAERERYLGFTRSLASLGVVVLARADARLPDVSFSDLAGKSVATVRDGFIAESVRQQQPAARMLAEPDTRAALTSLALGRADFVVMETSQATWQLRQLGLTGVKVVGQLPLLYKPAIGVAREQPWLHERLSAAVETVSGPEREAAAARWLIPRDQRPWLLRQGALVAVVVAALLLLVAGALLTVFYRKLAVRRRDLYRAGAMLKRASQAANLGAWVYDVRQGKLEWTEQIFHIHGVRPDEFEVTPRGGVRLFVTEDRPQLRAALAACLTRGEAFSVELRAQRPDGECRWLLLTGDAERGSDGKIVELFGTVRDVDAIKRQTLELERSEKMYRTLADNVGDVITVHLATPGSEYVYVTPSSERVIGYRSDELIGQMPHLLMHEHDQADTRRFHERVLAGDAAGSVTYRHRHRDGSWVWLETRAKPVRDEQGAVTEVVAVSRDVTDRVQANEALRESENRYRHLAYHDSLTGLPNRDGFVLRLGEALARAQAGRHSIALCFLDTDNFKHVNDSRGHTAGDRVLREIGARLAREVPDTFYVARLGGDEFVALVERHVDEQTAEAAAERLLGIFTRPLELRDGPVYLTASVGVAFYPQHATDAEALLSAADTAMYAAKDAGRNTWRLYSPRMGAALSRKARALQNVRNAFERDELVLHYQPRVDLRTGGCAGVEALLRWRCADGVRGPATLIEAAEESGFIMKVGEWVLNAAAAQSRAWRAQGVHCPISVNVSVKQLQDERLLDFLREQVLADPGLSRHMEFEITESALARDAQHAMRVLHELRELGFRLHIDDFGTGYSSLSCLSRMPVDTLKIDRSFVAGVPMEREAREIVRSIMALGRSIELEVIAEGVETAEQANFLREHGCQQAQGFHFARPGDAATAMAFACGHASAMPVAEGASRVRLAYDHAKGRPGAHNSP